MKAIEIKQDDITEEMISDLKSFLDSNPGPEVNPRMAILYGRLRARGMILENGEAWLNLAKEKKKEAYKWKILNQMKQGLEEITNETRSYGGHYEYQIANLKTWTKGRVMQLGFLDIDETGKDKRRKSVLIEEWENAEFFEDMLKKYLPTEKKTDVTKKPF